MKLSEMSREMLEKKAKKLGVEFGDKTSDIKLRNLIRAAKKAGTEAPAAGEKDEEIEPPWPEHMVARYYRELLKADPPSSTKKAYAKILRVIDKRVPKMELNKLPNGDYDCFGIWYSPDYDYCNSVVTAKDGTKSPAEGCPVMPLCRATCKRRPDLAKDARALVEATSEADAVSDKEAREALKSGKSKATKAEKKGKVADAKVSKVSKGSVPQKTYKFVGNWSDYRRSLKEDGADDDTVAIYKWVVGQEQGFTLRDFTRRLVAKHDLGEEDAKAYAEDLLKALVEGDDMEVK